MATINVFGDFVAPEVADLELSEELRMLLNNSDLNVVNFEAPIKTDNIKSRKSGPNLCQCPKSPEWLEHHKFNLISFANNHIMDFGENAAYQSAEKFSHSDIIGFGDWTSAYAPHIINIDNLKIAFISATHYEFGTLGDIWDKKHSIGTAWINHPKVVQTIQKTRKNVDYLIFLAHAGIENIECPLPEWRERYKELIDSGCDVVIASHPHIIQGIEIYRNKPICYSLGNFYFPWGNQPDFWYRSLCANITISSTGLTLKTIPIIYTNNKIEYDYSSEILEYQDRVNSLLLDNKIYIESINNVCSSLVSTYDNLFYSSGYIKIEYTKKGIIQLLNLILRRFLPDTVHLLNTFRCESHRYLISRMLKNQKGVQ